MKYTDEMIDYIKSIAKGRFTTDITQLFNAKFNMSVSVNAIRQVMHSRGIRTGVKTTFKKGSIPANKGMKLSDATRAKIAHTWYRKGNVPPNTCNVGDELIDEDRYTLVKVQNTGKRWEKWKLKHVLIWEQYHNQKVPKGHIVIFLDGNKNNFDINNLVCISRRENIKLNQRHLRFNNSELTKTSINIVKLECAIRDKLK